MISKELKRLISAVQKSLSALESKGVLMEKELQDEKSENARLRNKIKLLERQIKSLENDNKYLKIENDEFELDSVTHEKIKKIAIPPNEFKLGRINRENEKEFQPIKLEDFGISGQQLEKEFVGEFVDVEEIGKETVEMNIIPDFEIAIETADLKFGKGNEYSKQLSKYKETFKKCSHNWKGAEYNTYGECTSEVCIECGANRRFIR